MMIRHSNAAEPAVIPAPPVEKPKPDKAPSFTPPDPSREPDPCPAPDPERKYGTCLAEAYFSLSV